MPFAHEAIFWAGAGAISVPIIIHLLNRRRFRRRPWAAMQFLLESLRKNRRRLQLEELILLLLRCLVVLMLALAVARFKGCRAMEAMGGGQRVPQTVVFLLDDSYSMGQRYGAGTLFSAATSDLADQIEAMDEADKAYVLVASRVGREDAVLSGPEVAKRVGRLKLSDRRLRLAECLSVARRLYGEAGDEKVLFLASDCRQVDLGVGGDEAAAIQHQIEALQGEGVKLIVMDYGQQAKNNLTVERVDLLAEAAEAKVAIAGQPIRLAVSVRNHGTQTLPNVEVRVSGRLRTGQEFREVTWPGAVIESIPPGRSRQVEHKVTLPQPGSAVITAALAADELEADNVAHLALDVRKAVQVLVVDGQLDVTDPPKSESYFLTRALDPKGDGAYGNEVEVIGAESMADIRFEDYDLVALVGVPDFSAHVEALQDYVRGGGGLAVFLGDRINADFYNGPFYGEGAGLSPYRLLDRVPPGQKTGPELRRTGTYYRLAPQSLRTDSILRSFRGEASMITSLIRFFAFQPPDRHLQPARTSPDAGPPIVLAAFDDPNESPAIVTRAYGRGTVLVFYTTASTRWNDWAIDPVGSYVVVMNDMRNYLTRRRSLGLVGRVGEPILFELIDKLPANPSDSQRRRMLVQSARLKPPGQPSTVALVPEQRFANLSAEVRRIAGRLDDAGIDTARIRTVLQAAEGHFTRGDLPAVAQALRGIAAALEEAQKSDEAQGEPALMTAANRLRRSLLTSARSDLTSLARRELRYDRAAAAGVYSLTLLDAAEKPLEEVLYARNRDPAEGDLKTCTRDQIAGAFGSENFRYERAQAKEEGAAKGVELESDKEYWTWAIIAMLVMLALETVLGQRFGHYSLSASSSRPGGSSARA